MSHPAFNLAEHGDAFLRAADSAGAVGSRHQLFVWTRLHLHRFVPHDLLLCQLLPAPHLPAPPPWVFNSLPLPEPLVAALAMPESAFWRALKDAWVAAGRGPCEVQLDAFKPNAEALALLRAGFRQITVHAVDGSQGVQPALWLAVAQVAESDSSWRQAGLQLCLPAIYFAVLRSQPPDSRSPEKASEAATRALLSARELEVLRAVRSALSNVEIGEKLGISALTVKNHLRKIMRKLGARSRVQAVAEAMSRQLIV